MANTSRGYMLFKINTFEFINNIYSFLFTKTKSNVTTCNLLQQKASAANKQPKHQKDVCFHLF